MQKNRKIIGNIFCGIGIFLLIISIGVFAWELFRDYKVHEQMNSVVQKMEEGILESEFVNPIFEFDSHQYIGMLQIKSLNLILPIQKEWSDANGESSPCRYYGSIETSDLVIAGHNQFSQFNKLYSLSIGDIITYVDVQGNYFDYTVEKIEVLNLDEVDSMISSDYSLTLFTCTFNNLQRYTIRCN